MNNKKHNLSTISFILSLGALGVFFIGGIIKAILGDSMNELIMTVCYYLGAIVWLVSLILSIVGRANNTKADKKANRLGLAGFIISLIFFMGALDEITKPLFEKGFSTVVSALIGFAGIAIIALPIILYVITAKKSK